MNAEVDVLKGLNGLSILIAKMQNDSEYTTGNWLAMNRIVNRLRQNLFELTRINRELFEDSKEVYKKMNTQTYSAAILGGTSLMEAGQELSEVRQEMFGDKPEPESQPDGPVAESCDGYKIREGEQ
jgi:hypothetical protein